MAIKVITPVLFGMFVWVFAILGILIIGVTIDVNQMQWLNLPILPMIINEIFLAVLAGCVTVFVGCTSIDSYRVYQPFRGGTAFIVLQCSGVTGIVCSSVALIFYYENMVRTVEETGVIRPLYGVPISITLFVAASCTSLAVSLRHFRSEKNDSQLLLRYLSTSPNREITLAGILACFITAVMIVAEIHRSFRNSGAVISLMLLLGTFMFAHLYIGWSCTPGYSPWITFRNAKVAIADLSIWAAFFIAARACLILCLADAIAPPLTFAATGMTGTASIIALLLFIFLERHSASSSTKESSNNFSASGSNSESALLVHGVASVNAFSVAMCVEVFASKFAVEYLLDVSTGSPGRYSALANGFKTTGVISLTLLAIMPAVTHLLGPLIHGTQYSIFQPFYGVRSFVFLQASAWTLHAFGIFFSILFFTTNVGPVVNQYALISGLLFIVAQLLMAASIKSFEPDTEREAVQPTKYSFSAVVTGPTVTAFILFVLQLLLRSISDSLIHFQGVPENSGIVPVMLYTAMLLSFLTCPIAASAPAFSIRRFSLESLFSNAREVLALQVVGWILYLAIGLQQLVALLSVTEKSKSGGGGGLGVQEIVFEHTLEGVFSGAPFTIICASVWLIFVEVAQRKDALRDSLCALNKILDKIGDEPLRDDVREAVNRVLSVGSVLLDRDEVEQPWKLCTPTSPGLTTESSVQWKRSRVSAYIFAFIVGGVLVLLSVGTLLHDPVTSRVCITVEMLIETLSAVVIHGVYGRYLYGKEYRLFMPFTGGGSYILFQSASWGALGVSLVLNAYRLAGHSSGVLGVLLSGLFGTIAQILFVTSMKYFVRKERTMLEEYPEGFLSVLLFFGTFAFLKTHDTLASNSSDNSAMPIVVTMVVWTIAMPLASVSLRRSAHRSSSSTSDNSGEEESGSTRNVSCVSTTETTLLDEAEVSVQPPVSSLAYPQMLLLEFTAQVLMIMFPILPLYALYYSSRKLRSKVISFVSGTKILFVILSFFIAFILASRSASGRNVLHTIVIYTKVFLPHLIPFFLFFCGFMSWLAVRGFGVYVFCVFHVTLTLIPGRWRRQTSRIAALLLAFVIYSHTQKWMAPNGGTAADTAHSRLKWPEIISAAQAFAKDALPIAFFVFYGATLRGSPEIDGSNFNERVFRVIYRYLLDVYPEFFDLKVFCAAERDAALAGQFVCGYHPHGVFPTTVLWMQETPQFRKVMPEFFRRICPFAASIIFRGPYMRDFNMACNCRVVTRHAIDVCLNQGNSALIVVGGQSEMILMRVSTKEMHLVTFHRGFGRIALQHKVPLLPVLSFGEQNMMDNVHLTRTQIFFLNYLGFPFPSMPMGWCRLCIPNRTPLRIVLGHPVYPESGFEDPNNNEHVIRFVNRYFDELRDTFYKYREKCGFAEMELYFHSNRHNLLSCVRQTADVPFTGLSEDESPNTPGKIL